MKLWHECKERHRNRGTNTQPPPNRIALFKRFSQASHTQRTQRRSNLVAA